MGAEDPPFFPPTSQKSCDHVCSSNQRPCDHGAVVWLPCGLILKQYLIKDFGTFYFLWYLNKQYTVFWHWETRSCTKMTKMQGHDTAAWQHGTCVFKLFYFMSFCFCCQFNTVFWMQNHWLDWKWAWNPGSQSVPGEQRLLLRLLLILTFFLSRVRGVGAILRMKYGEYYGCWIAALICVAG